MTGPAVAILQNQFRLSGRTKVVCEVIQLLNELDIVPDLLTFTPPTVGRHIGRFFGLEDLQFNHIQVAPIPFVRGALWQVLAINWLTRARHGCYDLVFNSNDALQGLNSAANYLHFVYYPLLTGADLARVQEFHLRFFYSKVCAWILARSGEALLNDTVYTISEFSKNALLQTFPGLSGKVSVCYPPSFNGEISCHADRMQRCMSVGSFIPDKNQTDQLAIASQLPEIEFWIVGNVRSQSYFHTCKGFIRRTGVRNVYLKTDMPFDELQSALRGSMFFLHTMKDEHFGMSTVEAIAAGCIPIVHDSGGQREIVPFEDLRFNSMEQAVEIFHSLVKMAPGQISEIRQALQQHIQPFSRDAFRERMRKALQEKLAI